MHRVPLLAVAIFVTISACSSGNDGSATPDSVPPEILGLVELDIASAEHTEDPVTYDITPPAGGDHFPSWLNCGVYEVQPPDEVVVHALEHGAVWIAYQPDLDEADLVTLVDAFGSRDKIVITPHDAAPRLIALRAWGFALDVDEASDPRIAEFGVAFEGAQSAPEPGAPCSGALGIGDVTE